MTLTLRYIFEYFKVIIMFKYLLTLLHFVFYVIFITYIFIDRDGKMCIMSVNHHYTTKINLSIKLLLPSLTR